MSIKSSNIKSQQNPQGSNATPTLTLILIVIIQVAAGYGLFYLVRILLIPSEIKDPAGFIKIMAAMVLSFALAAWFFGVIGLWIRKVKPLKAGIRLLTSIGLALIPALILAYLGFTVGFEDLSVFNGIVVGKMIPYYTNLTMVMSILGFYLQEWFSKVVKPKQNK